MNYFQDFTLSFLKDGSKIHIKEENKGKFTESAKRAGESVQEHAHKVLNNPHATKLQKKRAQFAVNAKKWKAQDGMKINPYDAGNLTETMYKNFSFEDYGEPWHHYKFTIPEQLADKLGYLPDERGHRDDRVKLITHPSSPYRGKWKSLYQFDLTDFGMNNPNHTIFGLADGGQDPQAVVTYKGGIVLPEITVTPKSKYVMNPYDNRKFYL